MKEIEEIMTLASLYNLELIPLVQVFGHLEVSEDTALIALSIANILTTPVLIVEMCIGTGIWWNPRKNVTGAGTFYCCVDRCERNVTFVSMVTCWMQQIARKDRSGWDWSEFLWE